MRYRLPLVRLHVPATCYGCDDNISCEYAINCLDIQVMDILGASLVYKNLIREPVVWEVNDAANTPAVIVHL